MNILVTGATGFLGRFLCPFLKSKGHRVYEAHSKNCDLQKIDSLHQFDEEKFDQIYHLAAWTQAGDFCLYHPAEQWLINQKIHTHMLDWWHQKQAQAKLIAIGTSCSYDPKCLLEENNYLEGSPIDSLFTYAMTKRMLLCGLQALHKQFGLEYLYLVPSTLYGTNYHQDGRQMHFIFDLMRKILRAHLFGEEVTLWGDGHQKREIVHVDDFIKAMYYLVAHEKNQIINIGSGKEYSIREFAQEICSQIGYPFSKIQFDTSKYVGARSKSLSIEKLKAAFPAYSPKNMKEGVQEVLHWLYNNQQIL